jgi:hypothetical protein
MDGILVFLERRPFGGMDLWGERGVELADPAGGRARDRDIRGPGRVQERAPGSGELDLDAERRRDKLDEALRVVEVGGAGAVAPAGARQLSYQDRCEPVRLCHRRRPDPR